MSNPPQTLEYATPVKKPPFSYRLGLWIAQRRRLVFAIGLGLVLGGFGGAIEVMGRFYYGNAWLMFFGGVMIGLTWPPGRLSD